MDQELVVKIRCAGWCWLVLDAEARLSLDFKKKNGLSSGYQDLMGHLILTTSP